MYCSYCVCVYTVFFSSNVPNICRKYRRNDRHHVELGAQMKTVCFCRYRYAIKLYYYYYYYYYHVVSLFIIVISLFIVNAMTTSPDYYCFTLVHSAFERETYRYVDIRTTRLTRAKKTTDTLSF